YCRYGLDCLYSHDVEFILDQEEEEKKAKQRKAQEKKRKKSQGGVKPKRPRLHHPSTEKEEEETQLQTLEMNHHSDLPESNIQSEVKEIKVDEITFKEDIN